MKRTLKDKAALLQGHKRSALFGVMMLLCVMLLAGCAGGTADATTEGGATSSMLPTDTLMATNSPMPQTEAPTVTDDAGVSAGATADTIESALAASDDARTEVEKLSEVSSAYVVVLGDQAIAAVEFDAQYKGDLTSRVEEMVVSRVKEADSAVSDVTVTADSALGSEIEALYGKIKDGSVTFVQAQSQMEAIMTKAKGVNG
ncbi:MAG: YhcN/YlaJ family sporulation lipoprotein [Eubacteriales bacterium]|nr:YhcN/YlaJ family sporulation lipoprotein [Eubacteriales bacterium]MDD3881947.1 YhcN/YlaJ family sporulation lipoprotein [Eubacteriales bacterium]MDD4513812.1 YhcN/YlaJ family sporulation lipoprotein [Eubacteriales bacterium]